MPSTSLLSSPVAILGVVLLRLAAAVRAVAIAIVVVVAIVVVKLSLSSHCHHLSRRCHHHQLCCPVALSPSTSLSLLPAGIIVVVVSRRAVARRAVTIVVVVAPGHHCCCRRRRHSLLSLSLLYPAAPLPIAPAPSTFASCCPIHHLRRSRRWLVVAFSARPAAYQLNHQADNVFIFLHLDLF